jgi:alkanesulfonate monooxygenase SsuD/methylene tetrahydromethanopterin reductase-like flavin-dependent oxidoreductase (luciferase family)
VLAPRVADLRKGAREAVRSPSDLLIFTLLTVIVGRTDAEGQAKYAEYRGHVSHEGAFALMAGWTGIDFAEYDLDEPIKYIKNDAIQSATEALTSADPDRVWTVREVAEFGGIGGLGPVVVGSPERVADELQSWVAETDIDGFNLAYAVTPETFSDIVDLLVPELQRRGVYKQDYAPGTLREKLFGRGAHLTAPHPAAGYRHWMPHSAGDKVRADEHEPA